jgi:hypothetical protein
MSMIFLGHVAVVGVLVYWWLCGGFEDSEFKIALSIFTPVLSIQAGIALRHYLKFRRQSDKERDSSSTSISFAIISVTVIISYYIVMVLIISGKALNFSGLNIGDTFVTVIGISQSLIGAYFGALISDVFEA